MSVNHPNHQTKKIDGYIALSELTARIGSSNIRKYAEILGIKHEQFDVGMKKRKPKYYELSDAMKIVKAVLEYPYRYNADKTKHLKNVLKELEDAR